MRVLLVSTYELGHQPLHLASPAAALRAAGHEVRTLDLSVEAWDDEPLAWAEAVALSVPMHTAMRLALRVAAAVREARPQMPVCLYGLYATVSTELTLDGLADRVIAGEYEPELVAWVDGLGADTGAVVDLGRGAFQAPERRGLPPLERYAHLAVGEDQRLAGYVEASHGCVHRCRHCPVPVIYDGRLRIVAEDVVLADVEALAAAGARHVTFGDPDFLNGPQHSLRVVRAMHRRFPELTFDCTVKVEHILRHAGLWPELAGSGCLFAVTAVECLNDRILELLDKGHAAADVPRAINVLRHHGVEPRLSLLPFTPWSTVEDVIDILDFVVAHDLIGNVDPVQYTIRLLLPEGSLLLDRPELVPYLGPYDGEQLSYQWRAADPRADTLQANLVQIAAAGVTDPPGAVFLRINAAVRQAAGVRPDTVPNGSSSPRPRLTEPWFC